MRARSGEVLKNVRRVGERRGVGDHAHRALPVLAGLLGDGAQAVDALGAPILALAGKVDPGFRQAGGLERGLGALDDIGGRIDRGESRP